MPADPRQQAEDAATTVYRNPAVTVDGVVLHRRSGAPGAEAYEVLLIERGRDPFRGSHALPGGFVDYGEDIDDAIHREIAEETGLEGLPFRQFRAFGAPDRDPRGHTVSVVYVAVLIGEQPRVVGGDDAAAAGWFPVDRLPSLAFDHDRILAGVFEAIKNL
ncbi:MAG: NUDIX hydrolase [bacterium]|nr:NUDIX hydrolase [bacterium]